MNLLVVSIYYLLSTIGVSFVAIAFFFYDIGRTISLYDSNFITFFVGMLHTLGEILVCFQVLYLNYLFIYKKTINKTWSITGLNYKKHFFITISILLISNFIETFISPSLVELILIGGE